jgi:hypothetical protein
MTTRQIRRTYSFAGCFSLLLISSFLLVPFTVLADPLVLMRTAEGTDMGNISVVEKVRLSATLKMERNGDMVVDCLNLFSIPVARAIFGDKPGIQELSQRSRLQLEQKGKGIIVKLAIMF